MIVIKAEHVSKAYQLGEIGTGTLSRDFERWFARIRGKEDPFLTIGETNDRETKGSSDVVWSLKDLNFEIQEGQAVGIIGKNGAGKSTLLKLLSRVTSPTTGVLKVKGRVASLLEVGTGFHPELTGRENIYLNGSILGMRKKEITRKFDEIVDFSGVERYIDTPVKRYSSGMYVRLAFAVAAHLENEIMVLDEVLAVGDAEFQKKCLSKMGDVSRGQGRTVLFVSHSMSSIASLCNYGIFLEKGKILHAGDIKKAIDLYYDVRSNTSGYADLNEDKPGERTGSRIYGALQTIRLMNEEGASGALITMGADMLIEIEVELLDNCPNPELGIAFSNSLGARFHHIVSSWDQQWSNWPKGKHKVLVRIPNITLYPGTYHITSWFRPYTSAPADDFVESVLSFEMVQSPELKDISFNYYSELGGVYKPCSWQKIQ